MAPTLKLNYFDLPGRGEPTRLILTYGGIPFEDNAFPRETFAATYKAQTPFGQVPVLDVDGKQLAQQAAIERYAASLAGLIPSDPWLLAKADEAVNFTAEIGDLFRATHFIPEAEKIKARQDLLAGPAKVKLEKLQALLEAAGGEYFATTLSYADFNIFSALSSLISGLLDGVPRNLYDSYPGLKAHHNRIASLPPIAKKYENITEGLRTAFKPL